MCFSWEKSKCWCGLQVLVRVRPISAAESTAHGQKRCLIQESSKTLSWTGHPETMFTFDHVACETISQVCNVLQLRFNSKRSQPLAWELLSGTTSGKDVLGSRCTYGWELHVRIQSLFICLWPGKTTVYYTHFCACSRICLTSTWLYTNHFYRPGVVKLTQWWENFVRRAMDLTMTPVWRLAFSSIYLLG